MNIISWIRVFATTLFMMQGDFKQFKCLIIEDYLNKPVNNRMLPATESDIVMYSFRCVLSSGTFSSASGRISFKGIKQKND